MTTAENVRAVHEAIALALKYHEPPSHVSHRIAVLVSDPQDIQFLDAIGGDNRGLESGELCLFTSSFVIHAKWESPEYEPGLNGSSGVRVRVWPRKALVSVEIGADSDGKTNIDGDWKGSIGKGWPGTGRITLRYSDQDNIILPLAYGRVVKGEHVMSFLPNLIDDLIK